MTYLDCNTYYTIIMCTSAFMTYDFIAVVGFATHHTTYTLLLIISIEICLYRDNNKQRTTVVLCALRITAAVRP